MSHAWAISYRVIHFDTTLNKTLLRVRESLNFLKANLLIAFAAYQLVVEFCSMEYLPYMRLDKYVADPGRVGGIQPRRSGGANSSVAVAKSSSYLTRDQAMDDIRKKLRKLIANRNETFDTVASYTDVYNSWRNSMHGVDETYSSRTFGDEDGRRLWEIRRAIRIPTANGIVTYSGQCTYPVLRTANEIVFKSILQDMCAVRVQMDNIPSKESVQGDATQESSKDSNTIITRDQSVTESCTKAHETTASLASSEPTVSFDYLVGRWMPLKTIRVTTTQSRDAMLATYYLPETFLSELAKCAPNTIPFETFVYGSYDYEFKFVVNANKFQCGKVIVSAKFDSYQADAIRNGFQSHLSRPHIILDLSANNEGILKVPFRYHRAFTRNLTHETATVGVRPGKYASVYVSVLSPLRTGSGGSNNMDIRPFYMIRRADFAGMSYKVPLTQMDLDGLAQALPTQSLKAVLKGVEATLDQLGSSHNQDKPTDVRSLVVVPRPRSQFPSGKGVSDATVMRMNPHALTSFKYVKRYEDDPVTTLQIARIWGLRSEFTWAANYAEGVELFNSILDPTSRSYTQDYKGQVTPLEYVCGIYQFWSGPIDLRFDFVSNAFHTGSVIISAEYNRTSTSTDECQSHSTYTKTFHLGDQKSVMFRVPYIYDTVWRRSAGMVFNPINNDSNATNDIKNKAIGIRPESRMRVKVRILNALRPVSSTTSTIDVLVFMRAGPTFALHGLKQTDYRETKNIVPLDSFPVDNYEPVQPATTGKAKSKRETSNEEHYGITYLATDEDRYLPPAVRNKWNELLPVTQMDNGDKENEDETDNFSPGRSALAFQSVDSQVGIKDILRRPTLLFANQVCKSGGTGFFIPLMPPSRMMQHVNGKPTDFVKTVGYTPQAALMNLFRFWRGSMRYTIVVYPSANQPPIFVTHVPHTGTRLFGVKVINGVADFQTPIYGSGLTTEMIIPQVNPTACIEVPYDTENNWTLTFDEDALRNYSWRDKGDTTSGHLVLTSTSDFNFSAWWHAGDDFEVGNFYGMPQVKSNSWAYQWSDEHARVQMDDSDFRPSNVLTAVNSFANTLKSAMSPGLVAKAAICAVPIVGPAYTAANYVSVAQKAQDYAKDIHHKADATLNSIVESFGTTMSGLSDMVAATVSRVANGLNWTANLSSYCYDIVLDILVAWIDKSWTAVGISLVRFCGKVLASKTMVAITQYGIALGEAIAEIARPQEVQVQAPARDSTATLLGVLAGLVGTILGVKCSLYRYSSMMQGIISRLTEAGGMSYLVNVLRFVESTFTVLKEGVLNLLGYVTPEAAALRMLSSSSEILSTFVTEAQIVTSEANSNMLLDPGFRQRFWKIVMQAYQIQKLLVTVPAASASPVLGKLCHDVIRVGNEKFVDISAAPVRYEPFVICIEGSAGIGKSELVETLAKSLLDQIEFTRPHSGITYYRMPGSRFWSGYRDQPVVVYDDWLNITDPVAAAQQLTELYQLKSTSLFIPEMAHLEEKKIRGNPLIVILLCNDAFPMSVVSNLVSTETAVYRRRDVLLKASKKNSYAGINPRDMTFEEQTNFSHLTFQKYKHPTTKCSLSGRNVDYAETRRFLEEKFQRWHAQEQVKVRRRLDNSMSGLAGSNVTDLRIEDPFKLYYSVSAQVAADPTNSQNGFLPSEVLAAEVARIAVMVQNFQDTAPEEVIVPPEPQDVFEAQDVCVQGIFGSLVTTVVSTKAFLIETTKWTVKQLNFWMTKYFRQTYGATLTCSICLEDKPVHARCQNSTVDNPHVTCVDCFALNTYHRNSQTCPVCREHNLIALNMEDAARSMGILARSAYFVGRSVTEIGHFLLDTFNGDYAFISIMLYRVSVILSSLASGVGTMEELTSLVPVGTLIDMAHSYSTMPLTQLDDPFEDEEDVQSETSDTEVFLCEVRDDEITKLVDNPIQQSVCVHRCLLGEEHRLTYLEGHFHIFHEGGVIRVPEQGCADSPNCPFVSETTVHSFYTRFLREQSPQLRAHLRGFYNASTSNNGSPEYYVNRVPKAVRPSWMSVDPRISSEINVLSDRSWWTALGEAYSDYKTLIWSLIGVSAAVGGILTIHSLFKTSASPEVQYIESGDNRTRHIRNTVRALQRPRTTRPHFQSTDGETPILSDVVKRYVARNYFTIILKLGDQKRQLTACGLYGRKAILPRHYVKEIRRQHLEGAEILAFPALLPHESHTYTFDESDFICSDVTDLAIWTLPPSFGMFKDIRKFLSKDDDLEKAISPYATLMLAPCRTSPALSEIDIQIKGVQNSEVVRDVDGEQFTAYDVLVYNYSRPGACGSLVLLDRTTRPIAAMHFAGVGTERQGEGFGVILTQESVGSMLASGVSATQMEDKEYGSIDEAKILLGDANVSYMGTVSREETVFLPRKSKIRPSLIQNRGNLVPLTQPCILDKTDPRYIHEISPLVAGAMKHGKLSKDFRSSQVKQAGERLWDAYLSKMKPCVLNPTKLTPEEAVSGFNHIEYYDPLVLSTSAGFPWCVTSKKRKDDYVKVTRNEQDEISNVTIAEEVLQVMREKSLKRAQGIVPFTPFIDTLKDERRKPTKLLKEGGTRVFCNPPLDYVISMRQNFLHFTAAFMSDRFNQQHAVGINVNGTEWTQLARRLIDTSINNIITIDYSNFGPAFNAGVAQMAMQLMIRWLMEHVTGLSETELTVLLEECLNSQHLCVNTLYYQKCGSPSGATITTVINTLVNELLILIAWDQLASAKIEAGGHFLMEEYKKHVTLFCYGDDLIMSVSETYKEIFNAITITNFFKEYGIVATDASKGSSVKPYGPLTEATFLKMSFAQHEKFSHLWQSQLDWTSINDTTQWIWECADYKTATYENAKAALLAAHGHGKVKFNQFKSDVNRALILAGCDTVALSWDDIDRLFYPDVIY